MPKKAKAPKDIATAGNKKQLSDWFVARGMKRGDANKLAKTTLASTQEEFANDVKLHCRNLTK